MPRLLLPDLLCFQSKFARVSTGHSLHMEPQMNHFMLENFHERLFGTVATNAAHLERSAFAPYIGEQRNRQRDEPRLHADVPGSAREATAPSNRTWRKLGAKNSVLMDW